MVLGGIALSILFTLSNHYTTGLYFSSTEEIALEACSHELDNFVACLADNYLMTEKQIVIGFINIIVISLCGVLVGLAATYKRPKQLVMVSSLIALVALVINAALLGFEVQFSFKLISVALAAFIGCHTGSVLGNHLTRSGWDRPA